VELQARVSRALLVEGQSQRAVARELGLARMTAWKMLDYLGLSGYQWQQPMGNSIPLGGG